jgi:hypothetical protein
MRLAASNEMRLAVLEEVMLAASDVVRFAALEEARLAAKGAGGKRSWRQKELVANGGWRRKELAAEGAGGERGWRWKELAVKGAARRKELAVKEAGSTDFEDAGRERPGETSEMIAKLPYYYHLLIIAIIFEVSPGHSRLNPLSRACVAAAITAATLAAATSTIAVSAATLPAATLAEALATAATTDFVFTCAEPSLCPPPAVATTNIMQRPPQCSPP